MILNVEKLAKTYDQGPHAIRVLWDLELSVAKGESVAIVGQSGSGKSTLLSLLAGLDSATSGSISLAGEKLEAMDQKELSRHRGKHLGIVFQQFHLMAHLTAIENVALPLQIAKEKDAVQSAEAALEKVGLAERSTHFPAQLSGGERQRVAIARALVVKPDLMLADEPSGNLDAKTGDSVMELLFDLSEQEGMTLLLVTHNLDLAKRCKRVLELRDGSLHPHTKAPLADANA